MFFGYLTMLTALSISAVAIYYSVAGLVAIFAAAAIPIIIMGTVLELAKLVTAVWLHRYWQQAKWWLKSYLVTAVVVLMFITSLGIFGFLSKAHIEQTASAKEGVAQLEQIAAEIVRQQNTIAQSEVRIADLNSQTVDSNTEIQKQIDLEQQRIDAVYSRIEPAISEQNTIIEQETAAQNERIKPFEQQLQGIEDEIQNLSTQVLQYEDRIASIGQDTTAIEPVQKQITQIEESIVLVQGQIASGESLAIQSAQRMIGVEPDGKAGPNTRRAADAWVIEQQNRVAGLQNQVAEIRNQSQTVQQSEKTRLQSTIADIQSSQLPALRQKQQDILNNIDSMRSTPNDKILQARNEIAAIRSRAEATIAQSNVLIQQLRSTLTVGESSGIQAAISAEEVKIATANSDIEQLIEKKYDLEAAYRKLEAEVGPIKYLAEFVYGSDADQILLEEAVRWVIITIIFVFDPLAVLLLIASQTTFGFHRTTLNTIEAKDENPITPDPIDDESGQSLANETADTESVENQEHKNVEDNDSITNGTSRDNLSKNDIAKSDVYDNRVESNEISIDERLSEKIESTDIVEKKRQEKLDELEANPDIGTAKKSWKADHPDQNIKFWKDQYLKGKIEELPWENYQYKQNAEQSDTSLWQRIRKNNE